MQPESTQQRATAAALPTLASLARRPSVDVDFADIAYSVGLRVQKKILNGVSGRFRSGQLTAIMGSSGAGKSSLMDILAGNRSRGVSGSVLVNGRPRALQTFRRLSCYVTQEDLLQPHLTLAEAMMVAARLKLGAVFSDQQKMAIVEEVLGALGLWECRETFTGKLSGGQRKRFSIAQELVSSPAVIFLDEPTTGLDQKACSQCISVLKMLARDGCTVICSIHQPSATIFKQFDLVYMMSGGHCVYQGTSLQLVPFLASVGFNCPTTYNPADYAIEILHESPTEAVQALSSSIQNGRCSVHEDGTNSVESLVIEKLSSSLKRDTGQPTNLKVPTVLFCTQFWTLFRRMVLQYSRNKTFLCIMLASYLTGGLTTGMVFLQTGNRGDSALVHLNFMSCSLVIVCCCQVLPPAVLYPFELDLMKREYQNGWYSLNSYFAAALLSRLPFMHIWTVVFGLFSYFLSGQPLDWNRFFLYFMLLFLISVVSESYGLLIGTMFRPHIGAVVGPCVVSPIVALWQFNLGVYHKTSLFMKILTNMSFIRLGMIGMVIAMMKDRKPLDCDIIYCPFQYPHMILRLLGAEHESLTIQIIGLLGMVLVLRIIWYFCLRLKLSPEFFNVCINYVYKMLKT